jgi:glycine/D-amino acid oxidase-like deaminating enzyme
MSVDIDVIVVGAGLAGLAASAEIADSGKKVMLLDQEPETSFGGQAWWSFGGLFLINSPEQRRLGIKDSKELAWQDWLGAAGFDREPQIPYRMGDGTGPCCSIRTSYSRAHEERIGRVSSTSSSRQPDIYERYGLRCWRLYTRSMFGSPRRRNPQNVCCPGFPLMSTDECLPLRNKQAAVSLTGIGCGTIRRG